jgi:hypothetical protein
MRLEDKRRHAEAAIARLAALANSFSVLTAASLTAASLPDCVAPMAQTVKVSPAVYLGKSTAKNLVAKEPSNELLVP